MLGSRFGVGMFLSPLSVRPRVHPRKGALRGSRYAIRFNPMGWTTQAGKTYSVAVTGVTPAINNDVQVVACN